MQYDYDYEMVLLRHTISTMYHGIIFKSCKKHNIVIVITVSKLDSIHLSKITKRYIK